MTSVAATSAAFTFDAAVFKQQLEQLPQLHFIGSWLRVRHRDAPPTGGPGAAPPAAPIEQRTFLGKLAMVSKDVIVLLHCRQVAEPATAAAAAASSAMVMSPATTELRTATFPHATIARKNVLGAEFDLDAAEDNFDDGEDDANDDGGAHHGATAPQWRSLQRCRRTKLDALMMGRRLIVQRTLKAIPDSTTDLQFLAEQRVPLLPSAIFRVDRDNNGKSNPNPSASPTVDMEAVQRATAAEEREQAAATYFEQCALTEDELEKLRFDLAASVNETYAAETAHNHQQPNLQLAARPGGLFGLTAGAAMAAHAGGDLVLNRVGRLFALIGRRDLAARARLIEDRASLAMWSARCAGFLAMVSIAILVFSGYIFIAVTGTRRLLADHLLPLRACGLGVAGAGIIFCILLNRERELLLDFELRARREFRIARLVLLFVVVLPSLLLFIIIAASLEADSFDVIQRLSLRDAYTQRLDAAPDELCSFFRSYTCSGFATGCGGSGGNNATCPSGSSECSLVTAYLSSPCQPKLAEVVGLLARPALVLGCIAIGALGVVLFVHNQVESVVNQVVEMQLNFAF